ncbi:hypothetical protein [uncultured Roseibium sp.]|uniref:hypothetical protein n=1 Tax=uncultured Roseibium sp. TaxID=1936171 RepID=UPI0026369C04|nr:hypothetical protein [uncultured Roseibium sp.]
MAYITEDNHVGTSPENRESGFLNRIAAGFVSLMNNMYEQAKPRLPKIHEDETADIEEKLKKRSAHAGLEDNWDQELDERYGSRGYRGAEHFHYMYY